jgi:hypothetical protein
LLLPSCIRSPLLCFASLCIVALLLSIKFVTPTLLFFRFLPPDEVGRIIFKGSDARANEAKKGACCVLALVSNQKEGSKK